jgi:hypothetical protein
MAQNDIQKIKSFEETIDNAIEILTQLKTKKDQNPAFVLNTVHDQKDDPSKIDLEGTSFGTAPEILTALDGFFENHIDLLIVLMVRFENEITSYRKKNS